MSVNLHPEIQEEVQAVQEAKLASYGGWQEEPQLVQVGPTSTQTSGPLPLLDEADFVTPNQVQQDRPWWMQPIPRIIVAGGSVSALVYVLFLWFGLWGASSSNTETSGSTLMPTDTAAVGQEVDERLKQLQTENENLKREQVMGEPLPQTSSQPQPPTKAVSAPPKPVTVSPQPQVVARPAPEPPPSPQPLPPRPLPQQVNEPRIPVVSKPVLQPPKPPPPTLEQQQQKWLALSQVGNWGGGTASENQPDNSASNSTAINQEPLQPSGGTGQPPASVVARIPSIRTQPTGYSSSVAQSQPNSSASYGSSLTAPQSVNYSRSLEQPYPSANYPVSSQQPYPSVNYGSSSQVMVGTEAKAEIDRTLSWSGSNLTSGMKIPIRLTEPLKAIDNSEAIPAGSYLIAQVNADSAGNLQLVATSVLLSVNGRLQPERPLPDEGALIILGAKDGKPLRAHTSGGPRRGNGLLSTLGNVAGFAPLPSGNYSNGVYALENLAQQRNYQYEPITYTLKQGTRCRVYVNRTFVINF